MALKLSLINPDGTTCEYWRVSTIVLERDTISSVIMDVYLNENARTKGLKPVTGRKIDLPADYHNTIMSGTTKNPVELVYLSLKQTDEFLNALDV